MHFDHLPYSCVSLTGSLSIRFTADVPLSFFTETYVLASLTFLPLLVSECHVATALGGGTLLLLKSLTGGTRSDGGVLVEAVCGEKFGDATRLCFAGLRMRIV